MFILTDQWPVKVGQSYTYRVCTGGPADSTWSNCKQTNTVTDIPPPTAPPPPTQAPSNSNNTACWWTPPTSVSASNLGDQSSPARLYLTWTNPAPGQCSNPDHVAVYRENAKAGWDKLAQLNGTIIHNGQLDNPAQASTYSMPSHYTDSGLQPHTDYLYMVCEGDYGQAGGSTPLGKNCTLSKPALTGGAVPILTAARVNPTTVSLKIYLDNDPGISSISVTREGSDDPCRQGGTLANGLQGCQTVKMVNGVPQSPANIITVYNWTYSAGVNPSWTEVSKAPGYQITLPNDTTVKPGVEYYYTAHVVPNGDSVVVTVPNAYTTAMSQHMVGGVTPPMKGGAPPPLSQQSVSLSAVNLSKLVQPNNLKAVRSDNTSVILSWTATGAVGDTTHVYLMSATAASTPAATFGSAGWHKNATLSPGAPQKYTLPMKPAPSGQRNYYMVCAASSGDKATLCSSPVAETSLLLAPAPAMPH
ncbi:MAG: hypothetical protein JO219_00230 [Candidatus Eremiobacteraeota bacterium]|nr:hypothetical protein [Candidatus Eremiobacteraeota bacterium]